MRKISLARPVLVLLLTMTVSACASGPYPLLSPEDRALKQKVQAEVDLYREAISVTAVSGRIYLSSTLGACVENYGLPETIAQEVRSIDGVREVFNDITICGDRYDRWPFE